MIGLVAPSFPSRWRKRNGVWHQIHTHSHTQTKGTNVSHILTNSDNGEHSSHIYNDGAQQLFIVAAFVTSVVSIFGWQEVLGAVNDLWFPMKHFYQTCLWRKKKKKTFCWFDLGNNFCVPQHCFPVESFLSSHPIQSAAENLKTHRRWRWDFAQSLPFDICSLPCYIYIFIPYASGKQDAPDLEQKSSYSFVPMPSLHRGIRCRVHLQALVTGFHFNKLNKYKQCSNVTSFPQQHDPQPKSVGRLYWPPYFQQWKGWNKLRWLEIVIKSLDKSDHSCNKCVLHCCVIYSVSTGRPFDLQQHSAHSQIMTVYLQGKIGQNK